jgi:hypothetical protein
MRNTSTVSSATDRHESCGTVIVAAKPKARRQKGRRPQINGQFWRRFDFYDRRSGSARLATLAAKSPPSSLQRVKECRLDDVCCTSAYLQNADVSPRGGKRCEG